jgi:hypothetical protein
MERCRESYANPKDGTACLLSSHMDLCEGCHSRKLSAWKGLSGDLLAMPGQQRPTGVESTGPPHSQTARHLLEVLQPCISLGSALHQPSNRSLPSILAGPEPKPA